jgi:hypothetical protein
MVNVASPRPQASRAFEAPAMLFPEARRRRRLRWMAGTAALALCASGLGIGLQVSGSGSGDRAGHIVSPRSANTSANKVNTAAGTVTELARGRWSNLVPPHPGIEKTWYLAAWTGRYVIAWGSAEAFCETGESECGNSQYGEAFDVASGTWRSLPPAPVDVTVESTVWTGQEVLAWGEPVGTPEPSDNVVLEFDPATWSWTRSANAPMSPRSDADVVWGGSRLVVFGGFGTSGTTRLSGATYDPQSNRWSPLPSVPPRASAPAGDSKEPVDTTAAWANDTLYIWVTLQVSRTFPGGGESYGEVHALSWHQGSSHWNSEPNPPKAVSVFDATAVSTRSGIALFNGSWCLPAMSCPGRLTSASAFYNALTGRWTSLPATAVLNSAQSFVWTGRSLLAVSLYAGAQSDPVGGHAAAFDPTTGSWLDLPEIPVPKAAPSGPVLSGAVWAGSEFIDADLVLAPARLASSSKTNGQATLPSCPPITFPDWVGGHFCGPAPGPANGSGPHGSCGGMEAAPPCGAGMIAGRYYSYTLISNCTNDYIDGRWWTNELPGGSGAVDVWMSVTSNGSGAGWIGPSGAVGFTPSAATRCN